MFLIQKTVFNYHGSPWHIFGLWKQSLVLRELLVQTALVAGMTVGGVLILQLAYPRTMALPQARIGDRHFGLRSRTSIAKTIDQLNHQALAVEVGGRTLHPTPAELGVQVDAKADAQALITYTWRERLVPFSLFFAQRELPHYSSDVDEAKARAFLETLAQYNKAPADAKVTLAGARATAEPGADGYTYDPGAMLPAIKSIQISNDLSLRLEPQVIAPALPTSAAQAAADDINQRLASPLVIEAAGKSMSADQATLASWLRIAPDPAKKTFAITYDRAMIARTLSSLASQVYIPATTGSMIMLDGETTGRTEGANGRVLALENSIDAVIGAWTKREAKARAIVLATAPASRVTRTYSRSSKGLQTLMAYWAQNNAGTYGIALRSADGMIAAGYNGGAQFTSASIYKLYLAYVVYTKVANGEFSLDATTSAGTSVGACLDAMIVRSDNACAVALGDMVSWEANDAMLHAKGFGSTELNSGAHLTTANDTANYLTLLQNGSLLSTGHGSSLLSMMNRQIYRSGIPAGSQGAVANKVGFYGGLNHDAAIVYHPKGAYVLVVLTSGSSFSRIADLSRQISTVMAQ